MEVSKAPCHRRFQLEHILIVVKILATNGYLQVGNDQETKL